MVSELKLAIRLQNLDARAAQLSKDIAVLPKHIAEIEKKLEIHQRRREANRAALAANLRDRKKAEGDVQAQETKISKLKTQMLEAKTNEQYRAFQQEIEFCEREIKRLEDVILGFMSKSEPLETSVKEAERLLAIEKKEVDAEKAKAQETTASDQDQLNAILKERAEIARQMSPNLLRDYERIRKGRAGVAVAEVINGRCGKCNMAVRLQLQQELKRGDQLMRCESCGRFLYLNPPQEFEDLTVSAR